MFFTKRNQEFVRKYLFLALMMIIWKYKIVRNLPVQIKVFMLNKPLATYEAKK
jgi:hypothetical protein